MNHARFIPLLKSTWLVLKRYNLPRDLRRKIVNYVAAHAFKWETNTLREERCNVPPIAKRKRLIQSIKIGVETWGNEPTIPGDDDLQLMRMPFTRRGKKYFMWTWMQKNQ